MPISTMASGQISAMMMTTVLSRLFNCVRDDWNRLALWMGKTPGMVR